MKQTCVLIFAVVLTMIGIAGLAGIVLVAKDSQPKNLVPIELRRDQLSVVDVHGRENWEGIIQIGPSTKMPARIEVTSKGNGSLEIGNLYLKIYDGHEDLSTYEKSMLRTVFVDINADGYRDLLVSGRVLYFDEKGDDVIKTENVLFAYHFDPKSKQFRETHRQATFSIDLAR